MTTAADEWEAARYAERRLRERLAPYSGSRPLVLGVVVALLVTAGAWVAGAIWPAATPPQLSDGTAVVLADGRLFVLDGGTLYPAPNLASALLAAERVQHLDTLDLTQYPIGEPRGIAGALIGLPDPEALVAADWQLCGGEDTPQTFTIGAASYLPPPAGDIALVTDGSQLWAVSGGLRTPLDADAASEEVTAAVTVSPGILSLLPESYAAPAGTPSSSRSVSAVVCVQSDPAAPFAQPSAAAIARSQPHAAPTNNGTRAVLPVGAGLLVRQVDGSGYWLLSYTAELAPIADDAALDRLGYRADEAVDLPDQLITLFTPGPELSVAAAKTPVLD